MKLPAKDYDIDVSLPIQSVNYCPYNKICGNAICTKINDGFQGDQVNFVVHYHSPNTQQYDSKNNYTYKSLSRKLVIMACMLKMERNSYGIKWGPEKYRGHEKVKYEGNRSQ